MVPSPIPFLVAMRWARSSEISVLRPRTLGRGSEPAGSFRGFDFTPATLSSRSGSRVFEADYGSIDFRGLSNADTLNTGVAAPIYPLISATSGNRTAPAWLGGLMFDLLFRCRTSWPMTLRRMRGEIDVKVFFRRSTVNPASTSAVALPGELLRKYAPPLLRLLARQPWL